MKSLKKGKNGFGISGNPTYNKEVSKLNLDEFEKVLCYKALFDSTYLAAVIDFIKPKYFSNKNVATVFTAISSFYEKRGKTPTLTEVRSYLSTEEHKQTFKALLESLKDIDKNLDKDELYENTQQFLKEKAVYHTMLEVASDISQGNIDTSNILSKIEKSCGINLITDKGFDLYRDVDILIDDILNVQKTIPSTWPWLDEALGGGFLENGRALYVFAGESNIGKSIFLGNIATNIVNQGKNVLLVTLEMSELLYARRLCSTISKVPLKDLANNTHSIKQAVLEYKETGKGQLFIKEFPPSTVTPNQLKSFIKKIVDQGVKIDCIVLDYLNLLHSTVGSNSYERIKYVTEQVRALSYMFNCPIISATQLNRSSYSVSNPGLETVSESIGLVATSDVIVSIFQNEEDRELGIIRLGMMKNRYGVRGHTQPMRIDYSTLTISEAEDDIFTDGADDSFQALTHLMDD